MSEDFKKLDQFVHQHVPSPKAAPDIELPSTARPWKLGGAVLASLLGIYLLQPYSAEYYSEEAVAMEEILNWDLTVDEPEPFEEAIEFISEE